MKKCFLLLTALLMVFTTLQAAGNRTEAPRRAPAQSGRTLGTATLGSAESNTLRCPYIRTSGWNNPFTTPLEATSLSRPCPNRAPLFAAPLNVELRGVLIYDSELGGNNGNYFGVYDVPVNSCSGLNRVYINDNLSQGTFYDGSKLYTYVLEFYQSVILDARLNVVDANTGETLQQLSCSKDYQALTATYLPSMGAGIAYATVAATGNYALIKIGLDGSVTRLADTGAEDYVGGLAVDDAGTIYGLSAAGTLYTINPTTWQPTKVGDTGIVGQYISAMVYDPTSRLLLTSSSPYYGNGAFYSIDPATATASMHYEWDHIAEFGALFIPSGTAEAGAPATVTDPELSFTEGSLSGTISFTAPTSTYDGTPASGAVTYHILAAGKEVATGSTTYGAGKVTVPVTMNEPGGYIFEIYCSNNVGDGPHQRLRAYVGPDTAGAVKEAILKYDNGSLSLSWPAAPAMNDGWLDTAKLTYRVTRYVNSTPTVVAASTSALSFSETYAVPDNSLESIYYTVETIYDGTAMAPTKSNSVVLGVVTPPYSPDLSTAEGANLFSIIDANADGSTWFYSTAAGAGAMVYRYHTQNAADDYLVLPAARLEKGKIYYLNFMAGTHTANYPEKVSVYVGRAPEASALTECILPPTDVTTSYSAAGATIVGDAMECSFSPDESGNYYFAIKACSEAGSYNLYVGDIAISGATSLAAPGQVTDLTLTADPTGAEKVTVKFRAPSLNIGGTTLSSLDKVEVLRNGVSVKTLTPAVGAMAEFTDENTGSGTVNYSLIASNSEGEGRAVTGSVFVGVDIPEAPEAATVRPGADFGEVIVEWTPVTKDINGVPLTDVTYIVAQAGDTQWVPVQSDITGNSATLRICNADAAQSFEQFAVFPVNSAGTGAGVRTPLTCVGSPYSMPYRESFEIIYVGGYQTMTSIIGTQYISGSPKFQLASDTSYDNIKSQDGDNGYMTFSASAAGECARLLTGRIHLDADAANPAFSFYYFKFSNTDRNTLKVYVDEGDGFKPVGSTVSTGSGTLNAWNRVNVDMNAFKGKDIQVAVEFTATVYKEMAVDNFSLAELPDKDLTVSVSAATNVSEGENLILTAVVSNEGRENYAAGSYGVDFIINDAVVATMNGSALTSGGSRTFNTVYKVPAAGPETLTLHARVNTGADDNWENNMSAPFVITVDLPDYPAVTDLEGTVAEQGVQLRWSAPDYAGFTEPSVFDFESCDSFATMNQGNTEGWTFLDLDGRIVGGFNGIDIPNVPDTEPSSFFVFDATDSCVAGSTFAHTFLGHDGSSKYIAALYNYDLSQCDDWAISPLLSGRAQTISFFARSYSTEYPETVEVLYSTGSLNPEDFKSVEVFSGITTDANNTWSRYSCKLPEGAKRFALRFISADSFMVMIDDVTFSTPDDKPITLVGYNIYLDGVKLNDTPVAGTTYTAEAKEFGRYAVTAVYASGESRASNFVYPLGNSVESIGEAWKVKGLKGAISVMNAPEDFSIFDMQGRALYTGAAEYVPVPTGAYIVRCGGRTVKVIVK